MLLDINTPEGWDLACGLRGPDNEFTKLVKNMTTAVLRGLVFGDLAYGVSRPHDSFMFRSVNQAKTDWLSRNDNEKPRDEFTPHLLWHFKAAMVGLAKLVPDKATEVNNYLEWFQANIAPLPKTDWY